VNRRAFLQRLGFGTVAAAATATGAIDIERLLWVPGEKTIFIPTPTIAPLYEPLRKGDVFTIEGRYAVNPSTYRTLPYLQKFVVTDDVSSGQVLPVSLIVPHIITSGPYQTTTGKPQTGKAIDSRLISRDLWGPFQ
jgi:hypothetical protein